MLFYQFGDILEAIVITDRRTTVLFQEQNFIMIKSKILSSSFQLFQEQNFTIEFI